MEVDEGVCKRQGIDNEEDQEVACKRTKRNLFDTELLKMYYSRLFPYEEMFDWLSYSSDSYFSKREFSFTIENDIYIRYLSFQSCEEMKKAIQQKQPHKIDIGAVYSAQPKDHNAVKDFTPEHRELVFDIDLTDYDEVRTGCTPDMMWEKGSWLYMSVAIKIVDECLRQDFGFEHLLWVFSGRRGVHCWVCDERARELDDKTRSAIVSYLTLITGNDQASDRVPLTTPMHPSIERAMPFLREVFEGMVLPEENGQGLLADEQRWTKVLQHIPDEEIQTRLNDQWSGKPNVSSETRWKQLEATVNDAAKKTKKTGDSEKLKRCIYKIIILHTYPRLDVNVSKHRNHLLKSPFVIHPKTGKVCVPIYDVPKCHLFDPDQVPTLPDLIDDINNNTTPKIAPYIAEFRKSFLEPLAKANKAKIPSLEW